MQFRAGVEVAVGVAVLVLGVGWSTGRLDRVAPLVVVEAPGPPRGVVVVEVHADDRVPGVAGLQGAVDEGPLAPIVAGDWSIDTTALADGAHRVRVVAEDGAWWPNVATTTVVLDVDNTPPALTVHPRSTGAAQAEVLAVWVHTDEPLVDPVVVGLDQSAPLVDFGEGWWRALLGVALETSPGDHPLTVTTTDGAGNVAKLDWTVTVAATTFRNGGHIRLSKAQTRARTDRAAIDQMRTERDGAYTHWASGRTLTGPMLRPVVGRLTSPFGQFRTYSDGRKTHHKGTDIANLTGTPVVAAAAGEVRVAGEQHLFGNVVILNHGQRLATSYNHLSAIHVHVGDIVEAGQHIGDLGSTGQSTGPHLHWGMQVGLVEVDPELWPADGFARP